MNCSPVDSLDSPATDSDHASFGDRSGYGLWRRFLLVAGGSGVMLFSGMPSGLDHVLANPILPLGEDIPEEVLRESVILEARSPIDGKPLSAVEYAELKAELEQLNQPTPSLSPKLQQLVTLLKIRKFLKTVIPILPIK